MKNKLLISLILSIIFISFKISEAQTYYEYSKPSWTIGIGPVWNLATNDAYGRANYNSPDQILRDNYGMRWGYGGYIFGKYSPGKKKNDRIFLGFDYKGMANSDFSDANSTSYNLMTIDAGYEFLFYGTYNFRSYYGIGLTGNIISGDFEPDQSTVTAGYPAASVASTFRMGMELKAGLEFIFQNKLKNLGLNVGATYNLTNLFNADNAAPTAGQTQELNLNDGDGTGGPGFKRYIGIVSINVGLNIYPDVKRTKKTY